MSYSLTYLTFYCHLGGLQPMTVSRLSAQKTHGDVGRPHKTHLTRDMCARSCNHKSKRHRHASQAHRQFFNAACRKRRRPARSPPPCLAQLRCARAQPRNPAALSQPAFSQRARSPTSQTVWSRNKTALSSQQTDLCAGRSAPFRTPTAQPSALLSTPPVCACATPQP